MALYRPIDLKKCVTCDEMTESYKCETCSKKERLENIICPCCKGSSINEGGIWESNGVCGPGFYSHNTFPHLICLDCGVIFKKIEKK